MVANRELARMVLFSDAELESCQGQVFGRWRFILEDLERRTRFEAADWEPDIELDRLHLLTVIRGLEELDQPSNVTVLTTGRSLVHAVQFGLSQWRENRWRWERFGEMVPITDGDLWRRYDRAHRIHRIQLRFASEAIEFPSPIFATPQESSRRPVRRRVRERAGQLARRLARIAASVAPV